MQHRRQFLAAIAAASGAYAADWKNAQFPNWDDDAVLRLLVDSPWARTKKVPLQWIKPKDRPFTYKDVPGSEAGKIATAPAAGGSGPLGAFGKPREGLPHEADIIIRWASALPVRRAKALYKQREQKLDPAKLTELVGPDPGFYIVEIFGLPSVLGHVGAENVEAKFAQTSELRTRKGASRQTVRVKVEMGASLAVQIFFSRDPELTAADKEVEFITDADLFQLKERFRLGSMAPGGALEI